MTTLHAITRTGGPAQIAALTTKSAVIEHFGGTQAAAASRLGITQSALSQWPDLLGRHHCNVVQAAQWRELVAEQQGISGE